MRNRPVFALILLFSLTLTTVFIIYVKFAYPDISIKSSFLTYLRPFYSDESYDRSWSEAPYGLIASPPPETYKCHNWSPNQPAGHNDFLLLLGVFTTPSGVSKRTIIRNLVKKDLPSDSERGEALNQDNYRSGLRGTRNLKKDVTDTPSNPQPIIKIFFVSCTPPNDDWKWYLERENELNGNDVVTIDCGENIDNGKTYDFIKWVHDHYGKEGAVGGVGNTPRWVMKSDDDVS
jgi:hypothetical protein